MYTYIYIHLEPFGSIWKHQEDTQKPSGGIQEVTGGIHKAPRRHPGGIQYFHLLSLCEKCP